jgi:hypothetical protein
MDSRCDECRRDGDTCRCGDENERAMGAALWNEMARLERVDNDRNLPSMDNTQCDKWLIAGLCGSKTCRVFDDGSCPIEDEVIEGEAELEAGR